MEKWQLGKQSAMDEIYRRYASKLLHYLMRMLNYDEALAQDVLHDVFLVLLERSAQYDCTRPFRPYVYTIAANACRKHFRQLQSVSDQPIRDSDRITHYSGYEAMVDVHLHQELRLALAELSYAHRSVFMLRFQERFSVKEVAEMLDVSEGTVKSRTHHCLQQLAKRIPTLTLAT